jgi:hypothetical protein
MHADAQEGVLPDRKLTESLLVSLDWTEEVIRWCTDGGERQWAEKMRKVSSIWRATTPFLRPVGVGWRGGDEGERGTRATVIVLVRHPVGNPKRKVWWAQQKVFLSMKPRFIEPVGERTNFWRLMLAGLATAPDNLYMVPYLGRSFVPAAMWNLHTTQPKYIAPTCSEVVNLTGFL